MQKKLSPKLNWAERVSYLMDEKFRIPGTNFRFGIDPLLNLIPVLGDISGFAVSIVLVLGKIWPEPESSHFDVFECDFGLNHRGNPNHWACV